MAAVPPPAVGFGASALLLGLSLIAFVSFIVATGTQAGYRYTLGQALHVLARALDAIQIPTGLFGRKRILHFVAVRVDEVNGLIARLIGAWVAGSERSASYLFHGAASLADWTVDELRQFGAATYDALYWLKNGELPRIARYSYHSAQRAASLARRDAVRVARASAHVEDQRLRRADALWRHRLEVFARGIDRTVGRLSTAVHHALNTASRAIARARADVARIRGITVRQARRLARLERLLTVAGLLSLLLRGRGLRALQGVIRATDLRGAVLRALAGLGLGFLFSDGFRDLGRRIVKMPRDLLDELLALFTVVEGTMSLIEFAEYMIDAKEAMVETTRRFWEAE